jgi:hypothetical protein
MAILKPILMLAILSSVMVCNNAWATEPPPRVGATRDEAKPAAKPAPATPQKKPAKRRSVRQTLDDAPAPVVYSPRLTPAAPVGVQPLPSPLAPPQILNGCPSGACTDAAGAHYHGGVGTTLLSPQGRMCSNNGITVQCF